MGSSCGACGNQPEDIYLCPGCRDILLDDLRRVESTVEAIWAAAARMNVGNGSVGTSGHSAPAEPTNARAYDTGRTLNVILTGWARAIGHNQPHAVKAAHVLIAQIREVRGQDWAPVLKQELREALTDCDRATDRSAPKVFAGICPTEENGEECGTPVYAPEGRPEARCQTCGTAWDVTEWRNRAMIAAGPATATARDLSRILSDPIRSLVFPENKVAMWVRREKLEPVGHLADGRAMYRVSEVRELWEKSILEAAVRSARAVEAKVKREAAELAELAELQKRRMARRATRHAA